MRNPVSCCFKDGWPHFRELEPVCRVAEADRIDQAFPNSIAAAIKGEIYSLWQVLFFISRTHVWSRVGGASFYKTSQVEAAVPKTSYPTNLWSHGGESIPGFN